MGSFAGQQPGQGLEPTFLENSSQITILSFSLHFLSFAPNERPDPKTKKTSFHLE